MGMVGEGTTCPGRRILFRRVPFKPDDASAPTPAPSRPARPPESPSSRASSSWAWPSSGCESNPGCPSCCWPRPVACSGPASGSSGCPPAAFARRSSPPRALAAAAHGRGLGAPRSPRRRHREQVRPARARQARLQPHQPGAGRLHARSPGMLVLAQPVGRAPALLGVVRASRAGGGASRAPRGREPRLPRHAGCCSRRGGSSGSGEPLGVLAAPALRGGLILFTFFMISDPKTTPDPRRGRDRLRRLPWPGSAFVLQHRPG